MIDSHCHLDRSPLLENISDVLIRSKNAGVEKLLTISTNKDSFEKILNLIKYDPMIYGTFGIHPHEADKELLLKDEIINKVKENNKIIGVGETGLDFYYSNSDKKNQIESFKNHIEASLFLNVPIIIHSRNAENETFEILNDFRDKKLKILMHCYTGSKSFAKKLLNFDAFFSASGIITFNKTIELQDTFKIIPEDKLLVETDSPFLAPVPMRGKKNEPSFIKYTLNKLALIKNLDVDYLDKLTTKNFNKLFF